MDDVYQYTNEAVQSNRGTQQQEQGKEEQDVILNAFNNFGFGQRWSSLVDTVKKQVQNHSEKLSLFYFHYHFLVTK